MPKLSRQPRELDFDDGSDNETSSHPGRSSGMKNRKESTASGEDSDDDVWPLSQENLKRFTKQEISHHHGRRGKRTKQEKTSVPSNEDNDSLDIWPLSQENLKQFTEQVTRTHPDDESNDDIREEEEGLHQKPDPVPEEEVDDEDDFIGSEEDIFACTKEEKEKGDVDSEDERMDEGEEEEVYGTPPSQSLLADHGINHINVSSSVEAPRDASSIGSTQDEPLAGTSSKDSGCGATIVTQNHSSPTVSSVSRINSEPCRCVRICENIDRCVHQCSQIQVNIHLKPCQSSMCAINDSQGCQPSVSTSLATTQECQSSMSNCPRDLRPQREDVEIVDCEMEADEDDADSVSGGSERGERCLLDEEENEGDQMAAFNLEAFEDDDWPEEEALLASLQTDTGGSQNEIADVIKTEIPASAPGVDEDSTTSRRPNLCRPSYRNQEMIGDVKTDSTDLQKNRKNQDGSSDVVELRQISQKSSSDVTEIDLVETSRDSDIVEMAVTQTRRTSSSQISNLGKFFAPMAQTLANTKTKTQSTLESFFGRGSVKPKTEVVKTETQRDGSSGNYSKSMTSQPLRGGGGGGTGWFGNFRNHCASGSSVPSASTRQDPRSGTDSCGDNAATSSDAGGGRIDAKKYNTKTVKKQCPFYKKMPGNYRVHFEGSVMRKKVTLFDESVDLVSKVSEKWFFI